MDPNKNTHSDDAQAETVQAETQDIPMVDAPIEENTDHVDGSDTSPTDNHQKSANITSPIFVSKSTTLPEILFSVGLASIFLVYAVVAYLHPETIKTAYLSNPLGKNIGHAEVAVEVSMFMNVFLGILAFVQRWKGIVYALAGAWLLIIAVFKVLNLLG